MGYEVETLQLHSIDDNRTYIIKLPENDLEMLQKFENTIEQIKVFDANAFVHDNFEKCKHCIYEPACDRSLCTE